MLMADVRADVRSLDISDISAEAPGAVWAEAAETPVTTPKRATIKIALTGIFMDASCPC
jgi:hypothetical protein